MNTYKSCWYNNIYNTDAKNVARQMIRKSLLSGGSFILIYIYFNRRFEWIYEYSFNEEEVWIFENVQIVLRWKWVIIVTGKLGIYGWIIKEDFWVTNLAKHLKSWGIIP